MSLEILESKKGTKVVSASNLHHVLGLPSLQYGPNVRRWLKDLYEFSDTGIRKPQVLRDYARRRRDCLRLGQQIIAQAGFDRVGREQCPRQTDRL